MSASVLVIPKDSIKRVLIGLFITVNKAFMVKISKITFLIYILLKLVVFEKI